MNPVIIKTELYCHKIKITVTSYDPDFNCFKGSMVDDCPDLIVEFVCNQLAEGNRFGTFESIHEWLSEDIDTYYSGNWEIVEKGNGQALKEAIADITATAYEIISDEPIDSRELVSEIIRWGEEFCETHKYTDWDEFDYCLTVDEFATEKVELFIENKK